MKLQLFYAPQTCATVPFITLTEAGAETTVILRGRPFQASAEGEKHFEENKGNVTQGFRGTFDQLEAYLATLS